MQGKQVYKYTDISVSGVNTVPLQMPSVAKGFYLLQLTSGYTSSNRKIFIE
jgi:hypothetical protein